MEATNPAGYGNMLCNFIEDISDYLKSSLKDNTVLIPESVGTGFIKNLFLENGFCVRYFNFTLKQDLVFKWASEPDDSESIFKLITYLESSSNTEFAAAEKISHTYETENSIILYSTDFIRSGIIAEGTHVNRMIFFFTKTWLEENFREASDKIFELVTALVKKHKPTFIAEKMGRSHIVHANELAREMSEEEFPLIHIKTKGLILLNSFLNNLVLAKTDNLSTDPTLFYPEIKKVERRLNDYFTKQMPNIAELAAEFNMTESKLQRHFKMVYGKSVYSYYLEKKLALGKSLIMSKEKTISEIAYSLGYNKINSFSKAFKKHYGILPKDVSYKQAS